MAYKVIIPDHVKAKERQIVEYYLYELGNKPLATKVINAIYDSYKRISKFAESYAYSEDPYLHSIKTRIVHAYKNKYIILFHVNGNDVIIDGIYHHLQDYQNALRS